MDKCREQKGYLRSCRMTLGAVALEHQPALATALKSFHHIH